MMSRSRLSGQVHSADPFQATAITRVHSAKHANRDGSRCNVSVCLLHSGVFTGDRG